MFFKPRVFISSLLKNRIKIRDEIKEVFEKTGFDVLLYEKNLTPSSYDNTYRKDIKEADYIVIILDEEYGSKTDWGISGTEEEYTLAKNLGKKRHVYIKNEKDDSDEMSDEQKDFIDKIKDDGVSYYLYKNEMDLINRIQQSVATIAGEIAIQNFINKDIEERDVFYISMKHDYDLAIGFIAIYKSMNSEMLNRSFIDTNLFEAYNYNNSEWFSIAKFRFVDEKMNDMMQKIFEIASEYYEKHSDDFSYAGAPTYEIPCPVYGQVFVHSLSPNLNANINSNWYINKMQEYKDAFDIFIEYVENKKVTIDALLHD